MRRFFVKFICLFIVGRSRRKRFRFLLLNRPKLRCSCDIPAIDRYLRNGLRMPHPVGVVISKRVVIGKNCGIYQNVTLGARDTGRIGVEEYPVLEDNVTIYAGTVVIGKVVIGRNSIIGANSVVMKDIPANEVWAGAPARFIRKLDPA